VATRGASERAAISQKPFSFIWARSTMICSRLQARISSLPRPVRPGPVSGLCGNLKGTPVAKIFGLLHTRPSERKPAGNKHDPEDTAIRHADGTEQQRAGDQQEDDGPPGAVRSRRDPQCDVQDDASAARERKQREDDADERDIDAERLRDPRAYPGERTLVRVRRERR
jgi:hypothetical protein